MKDNNAPNKTGQHMDVTAPGKSVPSSSSKPIIVTNRPVIKQDPMIVIDGSLPDEPERESAPLNKVKISPISEDADESIEVGTTDIEKIAGADTPVETVSVTAVEELDATEVEDGITLETDINKKTTETNLPNELEANTQEKAEAVVVRKKDQSVEDADSKELSEKSVEAKEDETEKVKNNDKEKEEDSVDDENDDLSKQLAPNKSLDSAEQKEAEEEAKKKAEVEEIIESKKYFLPIDVVNQKRGNRRAILILILVIIFAVIWLDVVLDAGILKIGNIHPVTHFFSS